MKILLIGAGVIGTAYGVNLIAAGCEVHVYAHGVRTDVISECGLRAQDIATGKKFNAFAKVVNDLALTDYDMVLVSVRYEQLTSVFPVIAKLKGKPTVLFFGNNPNGRGTLPKPTKCNIELGFPGIGGSISNGIVKYIRISQQPTTIQDHASIPTQNFAVALRSQGFKVSTVSNINGWLLYHAVFVSCIAAALYESNTNSIQLSKNHLMLKLMCTAITEGFVALKNKGVTGLPNNLALLHKRWLRMFAIFYWKRIFLSSMGELCFAAHARHAKKEMQYLSNTALAAVSESKSPLSKFRHLLMEENAELKSLQ